MAYTTLQEYNVTSADQLFSYASAVVPFFYEMALFAFMIVITLSTYFGQQRVTGNKDFMASITVGAWVTTIASFVLSLIPGMIKPTTVPILLGISVLTFLLLLFSKR